MKRLFLFFVLFFISTGYSYAKNYANIQDGEQIIYDISSKSWSKEELSEDTITLEKRLIEGTTDYSEYYSSDDSRAFSLSNGYEFIKNGELICVDNHNLKYTKIIYDGENFKEIPLEELELYKIFEDCDIVRITHFSGNKLFIKKAPFKKKFILISNDTNRSFYKIQSVPKFIHREELRGLVNVSHIGVYKFKHYGARNGRLYIYVL